jgi:hypothetical protein
VFPPFVTEFDEAIRFSDVGVFFAKDGTVKLRINAGKAAPHHSACTSRQGFAGRAEHKGRSQNNLYFGQHFLAPISDPVRFTPEHVP